MATVDSSNFGICLSIFLLAILFYHFTTRRKSLTPGGAATAITMGIWVIFFAGIAWLLPLLAFFFSSTLLSKIFKSDNQNTDAKHGQGRDAIQVWCNGGIYTVLATLAPYCPAEKITLLMSLSAAISTSDTWASEIGMYIKGITWDIWRWEKVPAGLSGGVSPGGTLAGLAGSCFIACIHLTLTSPSITPLLLITLGGFLGMLSDSWIGARYQARYQDTLSRQLSDQETSSAVLISGQKWMTNDLVNLTSNAMVTALGWGVMVCL